MEAIAHAGPNKEEEQKDPGPSKVQLLLEIHSLQRKNISLELRLARLESHLNQILQHTHFPKEQLHWGPNISFSFRELLLATHGNSSAQVRMRNRSRKARRMHGGAEESKEDLTKLLAYLTGELEVLKAKFLMMQMRIDTIDERLKSVPNKAPMFNYHQNMSKILRRTRKRRRRN